MTKGFLLLAQNSNRIDYIEMAKYLALSIKKTQTNNVSISIVTDTLDHDLSVFDSVILIEDDLSKNKNWKLNNLVNLYDYSPYDETIFLESDMLVLDDISYWWDCLTKYDACFTSNVKNYKNEIVPNDVIYRQEFIKNDLPNIYAGCFYFKKNDVSYNIFELAKSIESNWEYFKNLHLRSRKPLVFSTDVAFALAIKLLGYKDRVINPLTTTPIFTHMKILNQGWDLNGFLYDVHDDWRHCIDCSFDDYNGSLGLKIGSMRQTGIFHYFIKDFLNDEMKRILNT